MTDDWRVLLYPLGLLSQVAFTGRFVIQWLQSEYQKKSVVPRLFWHLSIVGNIMLMIHSWVQIQYPLCVIQACNAVISWRNLNLMRSPASQVNFRTVVFCIAGAIIGSTTAFLLQGWLLLDGTMQWMRIPITGWNTTESLQIPLFWHLLGALGIVLFSGRFWVQWWFAEKHKTSTLNRSFWWISLIGAALSLIYFASIGDVVNIIGPAFGMIPYFRNLMLIYKNERFTEQQEKA